MLFVKKAASVLYLTFYVVFSCNLVLASDNGEVLRKTAVAAAEAGDMTLLEETNALLVKQLSITPRWASIKLRQALAMNASQTKYARQWTQLNSRAEQLSKLGLNEEAIDTLEQALTLARLNIGEQHLTTLLSLRRLAETFFRNENIEKASPLISKSWKLSNAILGSNHPTSLDIGLQWGQLLFQQGKDKQAHEIVKSLHESIIPVLGENHPETLEVELFLMNFLTIKGGLLQDFSNLCEKYENSLGSVNFRTGYCFYKLALLHRDNGAFDQAKSAFQKAESGFLEDNDSALNQRLEVAIETAELFRLQGLYSKAETQLNKLLSQSQKILEKSEAQGKNKLLTINVLRIKSYLARIYNHQGEYLKAKRLLSATLREQHRLLGVDHPETLSTLVDFAVNAQNMGHYKVAKLRFEEALEAYEKILGTQHPATLAVSNNLGLLFEQMGMFDDSASLLKESLNTANELLGESHPTSIAFNNNLALLYESQGLFSQARLRYNTTLAIVKKQFGEAHQNTLSIMNNLAYLNMLDGAFDEAVKIFKPLHSTWFEQLGANHPKTLKVLNNLGRSEHYLKDYNSAKNNLSTALDHRRTLLGVRHPDTLRSMIDYSLLLFEMGDKEGAEKLMREGFLVVERSLGNQHPLFFEALNGLANILQSRGAINESHDLRKAGFELRTEFLSKMLWVSGDNTRASYVKLFKPELDAYLNSLSLIDSQQAGKDLITISMRRKGFLLHTTAQIKQVFRLADTPKLSQFVFDLTDRQKEMTRLILAGPSVGSEQSNFRHLNYINQLQEQINSLMSRLGQSELQLRQALVQPSFEEIASKLPDNSALVDFLIQGVNNSTDSQLLVAILQKKNNVLETQFVNLGSMDDINKSVLNLRSIIFNSIVKGKGGTKRLKRKARVAYDAIWKPIETHLAGMKNIFVVADGVLNILPFDVLVNESGEYLLDNIDITLLNSSRDLMAIEKPNSNGQMVIFSGPDFNSINKNTLAIKGQFIKKSAEKGETQGLLENNTNMLRGDQHILLRQGLSFLSNTMGSINFKALQGAEKEGKILQEAAVETGLSTVLMEKNEAQEISLRQFSNRPAFLHIATHGFFLKENEQLQKRLLKIERSPEFIVPLPGDNPLLRTGLALAGFNYSASNLGSVDTDNDGILTAMEILSLDLQGTQMVVLSACETGLGKIHEGEGVYGLRRSFQEAGAQSVVASLWSVSDEATVDFMRQLYKGVFKGDSSRQSFLNAQRELRSSKKWAHPFYWSGFNLVGAL